MPINAQTLPSGTEGVLLTAKFTNSCLSCGKSFTPGQSMIVWIPTTKAVYCQGCEPQGVTVRAPSTNFVKQVGLGAIHAQTKPASSWSGYSNRVEPIERAKPVDKRLALLALLEEVLVEQAAQQGLSASIEKEWDRYTKLKALALRGGSENEQKLGMRNALVTLIKVVF